MLINLQVVKKLFQNVTFSRNGPLLKSNVWQKCISSLVSIYIYRGRFLGDDILGINNQNWYVMVESASIWSLVSVYDFTYNSSFLLEVFLRVSILPLPVFFILTGYFLTFLLWRAVCANSKMIKVFVYKLLQDWWLTNCHIHKSICDICIFPSSCFSIFWVICLR